MIEGLRLVEQAMFLRMFGERPSGAPRNDPTTETWADWEKRAEAWLQLQHEAEYAHSEDSA